MTLAGVLRLVALIRNSSRTSHGRERGLSGLNEHDVAAAVTAEALGQGAEGRERRREVRELRCRS